MILTIAASSLSLQREGVDLESIDFMVCNSGADTWHRADNGEWDADEGYQCEWSVGVRKVALLV